MLLMATGEELMASTQAPSHLNHTESTLSIFKTNLKVSQINKKHKRCRADASSELWKIVGHQQAIKGLFPVRQVDQIIPLRNYVALNKGKVNGCGLPMGQPLSDWQKGTPQSMQRAAWTRNSLNGRRCDISS